MNNRISVKKGTGAKELEQVSDWQMHNFVAPSYYKLAFYSNPLLNKHSILLLGYMSKARIGFFFPLTSLFF